MLRGFFNDLGGNMMITPKVNTIGLLKYLIDLHVVFIHEYYSDSPLIAAD